MPFQSKKQMAWMFANKPDMAKDLAKETKSPKKLPSYVAKNIKKPK